MGYHETVKLSFNSGSRPSFAEETISFDFVTIIRSKNVTAHFLVIFIYRQQRVTLTDQHLVHTTSEKFDDAALFLRLGLPSTLIRQENGTFRKRSSNKRNI